MQTFDQIVNQTRNLPESIQREILHFVEFIATRYRSVPAPEPNTLPDAFAIPSAIENSVKVKLNNAPAKAGGFARGTESP
ncbi:hypothetical protein VSS37_02365, partial [Candidatus Thiothrix sp. Deng01]